MKMEAKNVHYHHNLMYYLRKSKRPMEAQRMICSIYWNDTVTFACAKIGLPNYVLEILPQMTSGAPVPRDTLIRAISRQLML